MHTCDGVSGSSCGLRSGTQPSSSSSRAPVGCRGESRPGESSNTRHIFLLPRDAFVGDAPAPRLPSIGEVGADVRFENFFDATVNPLAVLGAVWGAARGLDFMDGSLLLENTAAELFDFRLLLGEENVFGATFRSISLKIST